MMAFVEKNHSVVMNLKAAEMTGWKAELAVYWRKLPIPCYNKSALFLMLLQTGKTTTTVTETRKTLVLTLSPSKMVKKKLKVIVKNPEAAAGEAALKRAENTVTSSPVTSSSSSPSNLELGGQKKKIGK